MVVEHAQNQHGGTFKRLQGHEGDGQVHSIDLLTWTRECRDHIDTQTRYTDNVVQQYDES